MKFIYKFNIILISIAILMFSIQINKNIVYGDTKQGAQAGTGGMVDGLIKETQSAAEKEKEIIQEEKTKQEETEKWKNVFSDADAFLKKGNSQDNKIDESELRTKLSRIFNVILAIGTIIAVLVGGILGIKFMMASAEDKAKIQEAMIPYVIGCIVIFGAFGIWSIVVKLLNNID